MKKLILLAAVTLMSLSAGAQGVLTIEDMKGQVPLEQWFVVRDKSFNNHMFYYAKTSIVRQELNELLRKDDQSIDFPKGKDSVGDDYWIILKENEHLVHIYLGKDDEEYSMITVLTE